MDVAFLLLSAWVHDLDPYMIQLWEGGPIRWYGVSYLAGFVVAWLLMRWVAKAGGGPLKPSQAGDFVVVAAMGAMIGGRLGYCVFYDQSLFLRFESSVPFWGVLMVNQGGMASHGGILGTIAAVLWFAYRNRLSARHLLDHTAFAAPLGLMFGRLANFVNGELYGRPCAPDYPLAVKFPQELHEQALDPVQLQALTPAAELLGTEASTWQTLIISLTSPDESVWRTAAGQIRSMLTQMVVRVPDSPSMAEALAPVLTPRHPSQLYAAASEGVVVMLILLWVWHKPRKPMVVGSWFALAYALMRVLNERFRLPDAQFIASDGGLPLITRGQWLSLALFTVGIITLVWASRSRQEPIAGWRGPA